MPFLKNLSHYSKNIIFLGSRSVVICAVIYFCYSTSLCTFPFFSAVRHSSDALNVVRVLLDTIELPLKSPLLISTSGTRMSMLGGKKKPVAIATNSISIFAKRDSLIVQGARFSAPAELSSDGNMCYGGKTYHGTIRILLQNNTLMIINCVPLEQYISSVLKTESWPGWPLEVNKAFAVTSRTYVLYMMLEAQKAERCYDVHNTKKHQTYSGVHDTKILQDAVAQTQGMILTYEHKPILAMFDSCCGGIIPARMHDVNFKDAPYLARTYACTYCKSLWIYNWKAVFTTNQLSEQLFKDEKKKPNIRSLRITKKDPAGVIHEVEINAGKKIRIPGKELYHALKEVKSFAYTVKHEKDKIVFQGRGYGHHLGLCQWGAREMVREGWNYKRILHFYYPGTQLVRYNALKRN